MSTVGIVLVALVIAVGLVGIVVPLIPGILLVFGAIAVWAVVENNVTAWVTLGVVAAAAGRLHVDQILVAGAAHAGRRREHVELWSPARCWASSASSSFRWWAW